MYWVYNLYVACSVSSGEIRQYGEWLVSRDTSTLSDQLTPNGEIRACKTRARR